MSVQKIENEVCDNRKVHSSGLSWTRQRILLLQRVHLNWRVVLDTVESDRGGPRTVSLPMSDALNFPILNAFIFRIRSLPKNSFSSLARFRVLHPRGLFYSVSQRAILYSYHKSHCKILTSHAQRLRFASEPHALVELLRTASSQSGAFHFSECQSPLKLIFVTSH